MQVSGPHSPHRVAWTPVVSEVPQHPLGHLGTRGPCSSHEAQPSASGCKAALLLCPSSRMSVIHARTRPPPASFLRLTSTGYKQAGQRECGRFPWGMAGRVSPQPCALSSRCLGVIGDPVASGSWGSDPCSLLCVCVMARSRAFSLEGRGYHPS